MIKSLKSTLPGCDEVPVSSFRDNTDIPGNIILQICNRSLLQRIFPVQLKRAKVVLIFKSGDRLFFVSLINCCKFQIYNVSYNQIEIPFNISFASFSIICIFTFQRKCHSRHFMLYTIIHPHSFQSVSF